MTFDGTMIYNKMGLADMSAAQASFSHELDQIKQEAQNLLAGSEQFFTGDHGKANYVQAQMLINDGIEDGKQVLFNQSNVVQEVSSNFDAADHNVGSSFC